MKTRATHLVSRVRIHGLGSRNRITITIRIRNRIRIYDEGLE